jgi:CheY-like chemotaxis protein
MTAVPLRILIVDDSPEDRHLYKRLLLSLFPVRQAGGAPDVLPDGGGSGALALG